MRLVVVLASAFVDGLFFPYPWQADNLTEGAFALYQLWWYGVVALVVFGIWRSKSHRMPALALLAVALPVLTTLALFVASPGPLVRWRLPVQYLVILAAGVAAPPLPNPKRLFDFTMASLAMVALAVPFAVVAAVLWLAQRRVIFRQTRIGRDGRPFTSRKLVTMRPGSDGRAVAARNDDRITPLGRVLRSTGFDEVPQLWSILRGDMSLVGPRPLAAWEDEQCRATIPGWDERYRALPGLIGLAQVMCPRTDNVERLRWDVEYIQRANLLFDMQLVARGVWRTLRRTWV